MNEFELIHRLTRSLSTNKSVVVGPGDDCAVLDMGLPDRLLLFKTDAVVGSTLPRAGGEGRAQSADAVSAILPPWPELPLRLVTIGLLKE
jgi:hypothetical protein